MDDLCRALLEQSPACQWIVGRDYVFQRVFGDPHPIFGKPPEELEGRAIANVIETDATAIWTSRHQRALAGETVVLRERLGGLTWSISLFPLKMDGEIRYAAGLAREVSAWSRAEQELRYTVLSALKAQEFERHMAAKFLHDVVGQNLTALGLQLDLIRMDLEEVSPELCGRIAETQKLLEMMMEEVRDYSYELNPSTVERTGLRSALDRLSGRIRERFTGALRLNVDPSLKLEKKIATAFYHIAQEAVENALQHSGCSGVEIAVKSSRNGTFLEVRDNGRGFDAADLESGCRGLGLLSMEHYAAEAGLELSIASTREAGTCVRAAVSESGLRIVKDA